MLPNKNPNSDSLFDQLIMRNYREQFCAIQELLSGQGLPHFLLDILEIFPQLISNEFSDCIPNILWICSHVFELADLQLLGSTQFFTPYGDFPLITFFLGKLHCLFFQGLRSHRFLDACAKFFV